MLKHPTLDQLHALGLHGMAKAFVEVAASDEAGGLSHPEWLGFLLDREASLRQDKRMAARLRAAKLRQQACVEDIDYRSPRGLDRAMMQKNSSTATGSRAHDNLALVGPTGVGKSWIASALGPQGLTGITAPSCISGSLGCSRTSPLRAATDAMRRVLLRSLGRAEGLLVLDDWGLSRSTPPRGTICWKIIEER